MSMLQGVPTRRIFVDESGDHTYSASEEIGKRYLGVVGVVMGSEAHGAFAAALEALKKKHLLYDPKAPPILHRVEIMKASGPFAPLANPEKRQAFDDDLVGLIAKTDFLAIAVVLDKVAHAPKQYRMLRHPYHWSILALLERYCGWLQYIGRQGDLLAESRGKVEDKAFQQAYGEFWQNGAGYLSAKQCQTTLTTGAAKLEKKGKNTAGLQLADTLAHPLTRDVLHAYQRIPDRGGPFADRIAEAVIPKYNRRFDTGKIEGYGRKIIA